MCLMLFTCSEVSQMTFHWHQMDILKILDILLEQTDRVWWPRWSHGGEREFGGKANQLKLCHVLQSIPGVWISRGDLFKEIIFLALNCCGLEKETWVSRVMRD